MSARSRCQRSYDHRLKELVRTSGDPALAIDLGIPTSTVMGWLRNPPQQVVTLDVPCSAKASSQLISLDFRAYEFHAAGMKILLTIIFVQSLNLIVFTWLSVDKTESEPQ